MRPAAGKAVAPGRCGQDLPLDIAMDIRELRTLVTIVDRGSFAGAAEALGLSQSSVSLHIRHLEERFGLVLFDRSSRPPALSAEGRAFVTRARSILETYRALEQEFAPGPRFPPRRLRIGAIPTLLGGPLPAALARVRAADPTLEIVLQTGLSHELEPLVERRSIDCALTAEPDRIHPGFRWSVYCEEPLVVIAPQDVPGETDEDLLTAGPFIRFKRFAWAAKLIDAELSRRDIRVETTMEVDTLDGIARLVAEGLGVSVIPHGKTSSQLPAKVRALPFGRPAVHRSLGLLENVAHGAGEQCALLLAALKTVSNPPNT